MKAKPKRIQRHPYHLVDPSPWPSSAALGVSLLAWGGVLYLHNYCGGNHLLIGGSGILLYVLYNWWKDVICEGLYEGYHTSAVERNFRIGMILFIISEVMFFFPFFWVFFTVSLSPVYHVGGVWPPFGLESIYTWGLPLVNTLILLSSGSTITCSHLSLLGGRYKDSLKYLKVTLVLAIIFTILQVVEYKHAPFSISDGIYGSIFYVGTGLHGFHVIIGTIFLTVCTYRFYLGHFSKTYYFGLEAAAWYWHFVDMVWFMLFICLYWWGVCIIH